jgi:hypothetical protein
MTKSETLALAANATGAAISILLVSQQAQATLAQAQKEGWPDADPRWAAPFQSADAAMKAALAAL